MASPAAAPASTPAAPPPDPTGNQQTLSDQEKTGLNDVANGALLIRDALMKALPVAPEQYLTVTIPGTVIDTTPIEKGGSFVYDVINEPFVPTAVSQAEGKLVDYMTPLANVMIGNTGKSVSRSYSAALDYLVPKKATISSSNNNIRSPGDQSYDGAMTYLTQPNSKTGLTPVEVYIQKQTTWAQSQDAWDAAKIAAKADAEKQYPNSADNAKAVQMYNDWSQAHYRRYKNDTQARWMDWVTNGDKYNVEYNFGLVDVDSIMARIESSKQSMRNSTIIDADGANEIQEVNLTPKNWAFLCQQKANAAAAAGPTLDQYNAEIQRLNIFLVTLKALQAELNKKPPVYPKAGISATPPPTDGVDNDLKNAYTNLYELQGQATAAVTANPPTNPPDVDGARKAVATALDAWESKYQEVVKWNLSQPGGATWLADTIKTVNDQIAALTKALQTKTQSRTDLIGAIVNAHPSDATKGQGSGNDLAQPGSELANPIFGLTPGQTTTAPEDPWTKITASFSAKDQKTLYTQSNWGFSASGGVSFGLFSAGGGYSHDESTQDFRGDMVGCDVSISFSALVVNIDRPWLYGELFNDFEIDIASDARLSPGPEKLHPWIQNQQTDQTALDSLQMYNVFPSFPTAFIVGADAVLEFTGSTEHIEKHFHSTSDTASASFGWGPFCASASYHSSSMTQSFQMETTATGCKITFAAPQIIAWVSQILPALPRDPNFEPLLQTTVKK